MLRSIIVGGLRRVTVGGLRSATWLAAALLLVLVGGDALLAQEWPAYPGTFARGPGFYLNFWLKIFPLLVVFWLWVKSADWVSRDTAEMGEAIGMPSQIWNPLVVFSFLLVFMTLGLGLPLFVGGFVLVLLAYLVPFTIYVVQRNGKVTQDKKVFTVAHIKHWLSNLGKRQARERDVKHAWQLGPPVEMTAVGLLQMENQGATIDARQSPGYVPLKFLLADALTQRADKIMLDYTADGVAIRYEIDGLWHAANPKVHERDPLNRELGDMMLAVIKRMCHLNMNERRARQEGKLKIDLAPNKFDATLLSQGTPTGERAILSFKLITKHVPTLADLGMREKMLEQVQKLIEPGAKGMVAFSALPGDGLTATYIAALRGTDRLMRDFISVEATNKGEPYVENVDVTKYDPALKELPEQKLPGCILKQPEVICVPEVATGEALSILVNWILLEDKLALVSVRAKEAAEALLRLLALKPGDKFPQVINAVINQRLVRKLCESCREAFQPDAVLLQRLGIPPGRVQVLFREKQPLPPGQEPPRKRGEPLICPNCNGLGYRGRTAIYEVLVIDDKMRPALSGQPKLDDLKQLARQAGNRSLQEEGILLVALGTTSLTELQRVLKQ